MSLTLNPAAITRRVAKATGVKVASRTYAPGVVKAVVEFSLMRPAAAEERAARDVANALLAAGYDVARTGSTITVTLPVTEEQAAEWAATDARHAAAAAELADPTTEAGAKLAAAVELEGNPGVILIDPRTPLAPEHLADAAAEAAVIAAETDADVATDAEVAERVVAHYVKVAVDNRGDDLEEFLADVDDDPASIVYEVLDTAADMGLGGTEGDARYEALITAANVLVRDARARFAAELASRLVGRRAVGALNGVRVVGTIYADDHLGRAMVTTDGRAVTLEGEPELTEDAATNAYGEVPAAVTPRERTTAERVYGLFYR